jgi:integron integrase
MKLEQAKAVLTHTLRRRHYSEKTVESYVGWMERYAAFLRTLRPLPETNEERVTAYLNRLAPGVGVSTQKQALCALVFFYREALQEPLGELPAWVSAKRPKRLPEWVTPEEAMALFERMRGPARVLAQLMFGSGLRLNEAVTLRVKDLRLEEGTVMVREGKGGKDRMTILPASLIPELRAWVHRSRTLWEDDRRDEVPGVYLTPAVGRKYPTYAARWEWHWVFPSGKLATDPVTGVVRRHHFHPDLLNKAIGKACQQAKLGRRVTSHAFRHGFATALLQSGRPIHEVSALLGHANIETTEIYLHCLPRLEERIMSPLDAAQNVTPIAAFRASA